MAIQSNILIFCDGACSGNPGPGGWASIVATMHEVRELGGGNPVTTNNQMEMAAIIEGLRFVAGTKGSVGVYTDSSYVIRGITQWVKGWRFRGWKTAEGKEVANRDLWEEMDEVVKARGKANPISWHYVRGHSGIPGNERCDEIAVAYSQGRRPALYRGPRMGYAIDIDQIPEDTSVPEMKQRTEKAKAHSYVSLLGGTPMRHATWAECERRVKGQSGAKFKKAASPDDEAEILRSWGLSPEALKSR